MLGDLYGRCLRPLSAVGAVRLRGRHFYLLLLLLCLVPALAGLGRLLELFAGRAVTLENARFFASPLPVVVHIVTSLVFVVGGVGQFCFAGFAGQTVWHRRGGRILALAGLLAALSGVWMTLFYPPAVANFDGSLLFWIRLGVGAAMVLAVCRAVVLARQRDFARHRDWMIRAYALGLGAGTQVFTHIPWFIFPELRGELLRVMCMGAGWGINVLVAEFLIQKLRSTAFLRRV